MGGIVANESRKSSEYCFIASSKEEFDDIKDILEYYECKMVVAENENLEEIIKSMFLSGVRAFIGVNIDLKLTRPDINAYICNMEYRTVDYLKSLGSNLGSLKNALVLYSAKDNIDADFISSYFGSITLINTETTSSLDKYINEKVFLPKYLEGYIKYKNIRYEYIKFSKESVLEYIKRATDFVNVLRQEIEKSVENIFRLEQYKMVFNFTNDAIMAVDENGIITAANDKVYRFYNRALDDRLEGKKIDKIVKDTKMIKVIESGKGDIGDIFELPNKNTIIVNRMPIIIDGKIKGAVSTYQDYFAVQEYEKKARIKYNKNKKGFQAKYTFDDIIGDSKEIQMAKNIAKSYATSNYTILILGESGTGKELFAQSIHNASICADGPFVAINCAAIPQNLLEAEFFGYEGGAFTGASKGGKMGVFELAHKGTIFLDEIGEMPTNVQVQLLRVIQEKEIRRIGSDKLIPIDVRVISATNKDLANEVKIGNFREDLFYRLNVLKLELPPLRNLKDDIKSIAINYLRQMDLRNYKRYEDEWAVVIDKFRNLEFNGNIRELQNMIQRISVLMSDEQFKISEFFDGIINSVIFDKSVGGSDVTVTEDCGWEKAQIIEALKRNKLVKTKAAKELGISRTTLWSKIKQYNIDL